MDVIIVRFGLFLKPRIEDNQNIPTDRDEPGPHDVSPEPREIPQPYDW